MTAGPTSSPTPTSPIFPASVRTAGIIWIVFGAGILINVIPVLLRTFGIGLDADADKTAPIGPILQGLFQAVIGGFFLYEGIASCRGAIPSTVGVASGSFLFALVYVAFGILEAEARQGYYLVMMFVLVVGLLVAGVLALAGRAEYDNWYTTRRRQREKRPS